MNNVQQSARVGLFFVLGIALIWVAYETLSGGKILEKEGYTLTASFRNLKELKPGDDVRMAGVKIGTVQSTRLRERQAEAVLLISPSVKVPADAEATVAMAGLLGSNYIAVTLGTDEAPILEPGSEIATRTTADLNTVLSKLGDLSEELQTSLQGVSAVFEGDDQGNLFENINSLVAENREAINLTLANLQSITAKIEQGEGTLGKLVNDASLHTELTSAIAEIRNAATGFQQLSTQVNEVIAQVQSGQGTLGTLLYDEALGEEIRGVAANLRELSAKLNSGEGTLGRLIADDTLYQEAQSVVRKADRALDAMGEQGPITAAGVLGNALF